MRRAHIGHTQPTNNAVRRDASPLECSGDFSHGLLKAAGLPAQQARAVVETVGAALSDIAVTKADVQRVDERFDRMDERFDELERRMDLRFEALEARLETRFAAMDARFAGLDARFAGLDARMTWRLVGVLTVLLASHALTVAILLQVLA